MEEVTITRQEYEQLLKDQLWLQCLDEAGVDNWGGIDVAFDLRREYNQLNNWEST